MAGNTRAREFIERFADSKYLPSITHKQVLALLLLSGFLINAYVATSISLWHDEAITANAAISFLQNGVPSFPSGFEYWRAFPYTLLVAASGYIFGITDLSLRLPSILVGVLTIALTYLTGKEFFDRDIGLIASAFVTFSALQVAWATQVRMYVLLQLLYLLSVLLIYRSVEREKNRDKVILLATLGTISFVHLTGGILPFVAILYWLYRIQIFNSYNRKNILLTPVLVLTAVVFLEFFSTVSFVNIFSRLTFAPENIYYYYELVFKNIPVLTSLGVIGSLIVLRKNLGPAVLMAASVFPVLYIYIIHVDGVSDRYIYFSLPFLAIWTALSIKSSSVISADILSDRLNRDISFKHVALFLTLLSLLAGSGLNFSFSDGDYRPSMEEKSVYTYIQNHSDEDDILITQWTASATYYYKAPEYSLYGDDPYPGYNSSHYRKDYSFESSDVYSGAKFIDTNKELIDILENNERGWIVLRDESYRRKSDEINRTLSNLYSVGDFRGLNVWKWNGSVSTQDSFSSRNW